MPKATITLLTNDDGTVQFVFEVSDNMTIGDLPEKTQVMLMQMFQAAGVLDKLMESGEFAE